MDPTDSTLLHVPAKLFTPAESLRFEGQMALPGFEAGSSSYAFSDPVCWQVDVTNTGGALLVAGNATGVARTVCARCLEDAAIPLDGTIEGYFLIDDEAAEVPEDMDDDEFEFLPENHMVDMEVLVKAALLLEVPLIPLCDEGCRGLCPTCGANLNEGACACQTEDPDEDLEQSDNPFAVLKDYTFDGE